jgi:hypothetical protein
MTEEEWLTASFAMLLMFQADHVQRDAQKESYAGDRLSVAARVACLERLGTDAPDAVRQWIASAVEFVDKEGQANSPLLGYQAKCLVFLGFREAYESADLVFRQRLAAAQDVFHGGDGYQAYEEYLLEADDNSPTYTGPIYAAESEAHCDIIRDIFGNPFRPVTFSPEWRTDTAVTLAWQMYESRDFSAMPILADALQDAGCDTEAILAHCRDENATHVRGCWVVDGLLGKS